MKTFYLKIISSIFIAAFFLISTISFILLTNSGTAMLLNSLKIILPQQFNFLSVSGRLYDTLSINGLEYKSPKFTVKIAHINVSWNFFSLKEKRVIIDVLHADNIHLTISSSDTKTHTKNNIRELLSHTPKINDLQLTNIYISTSKNYKIEIEEIKSQINSGLTAGPSNNLITAKTKLHIPFKAQLELQANGTIDNYQWQLLETDEFSAWHAQGTGNTDEILITKSQGRIANGEISIFGKIQWQTQLKWNLILSAKNLYLNLLNKKYPQIKKISLKTVLGIKKFTLAIDSLDGRFRQSNFNGKLYLSAIDKKNRKLENFPPPSLSIEAHSTVQFKSYKFKIKTQMQVNEDKNFYGYVSINSANIPVSEQKILLTNPEIRVDIINNSLKFLGKANSGKGQIQIIGNTNLEKPENFSASIKGHDFLTINTPTLKLTTSPNLYIAQSKKYYKITGEVNIPTAEINLGDNQETTSLPPETVIIAKNSAKSPTKMYPITADVIVRLGNKFQFKYNGLEAYLAGQIRSNYLTDRQLLLNTGKIFITHGTYYLKGKKLTVEKGEAIYLNAPIENPLLNIKMGRYVNYSSDEKKFGNNTKILVGIKVNGQAKQPMISFFSEPASWSQADILSFILFDQPMDEAKKSQLTLAFKAAQMLMANSSTNTFSSFYTPLKNTLGLSELEFKSSNTQNGTALVLGKYLSKNLYISYSLGVINALNTIRIQYFLNNKWSLQTENSSLETAIDLLYSP